MLPPRTLTLLVTLSLSTLVGACSTDLGGERPSSPDVATAQPDPTGPPALTPPPVDDKRVVLKLDDDHSVVGFTGRRPSIEHTRSFSRFDGRLHLLDDQPVYIEVVVDMTSIVEKPDDRLVAHLKTADFFDIIRYPGARFRSTEITPNSDPEHNFTHLVKGDMELHGKAVPIEFPARIYRDGDLLRGQAELTINRHDYDVNYQMHRDDPISPTVVIVLDLVFQTLPQRPR